MARIAHIIDVLNQVVGAICAVFILIIVADTFVVAVFRYVFNLGSIWLQEIYVWLHGAVFMLAAGYTLLLDGHVRVDVIYGGLSERNKAWMNLFGVFFFLLPMMGVLAYYVIPYVELSWIRREGSRDAGGLPAVYILKATMLAFIVTLSLQSMSIIMKNILLLMGYGTQPSESLTREGESECR
ncbi:TRAP transporter small permease subunit [Pseudorhodoplanes sp.]|uniref:TRAP transporter small permease subunit n=1 Tax=Pseudorhodoplanes sp. TaxID=1934341 RepID=UPI003D0F934B